MELFTLDRKFLKQDDIDTFHSAIWTDRYYGDGDIELHVPATKDWIEKLKEGTFIGERDSDDVMILETVEIEEGKLKATGITLLKWLNNRFIRTTPAHQDRYWALQGRTVGDSLGFIVYYMCVGGGYLDGTVPIGIANPQALKIPGLSLGDLDNSGSAVSLAVPYGPLYDALKSIATTYQVGMQIALESATDAGYSLKFRTYRGLNRTSSQSVNEQVRFSPEMDSLTDIKELRSISDFKTNVWTFAPANPGELAGTPGYSNYGSYSGFDLRAMMVFCEDITTDAIGGSAQTLVDILNTRARDALTDHIYRKVVDGEVVPGVQFHYGAHYYLGDIVELQGNSGIVQNARVTEYIRVQDEAGQRAYPTVAVID